MSSFTFIRNCFRNHKTLKTLFYEHNQLECQYVITSRGIHTSSVLLGQMKALGFFGAALHRGQDKVGVDLAPKALREANLMKTISDLGYVVKDYGDILDDYTSAQVELAGRVDHINLDRYGDISKMVTKIMLDERTCLTIGGDHSIAMGTIHGHYAALQQRFKQQQEQLEASGKSSDNLAPQQLAVIWIDAHADINTPYNSMTYHLHGMPVGIILRDISDQIEGMKSFTHDVIKPCLNAADITYIGLRDLDPDEKHYIKHFGIAHYSPDDVEQLGIARITEQVLEKLAPNLANTSIHLSIDIDSLDPSFCPSTGTSVLAGLTLREVNYFVRKIHETKRVGAVDLVEVNPAIGNAQDVRRTLSAGINIIQCALGYNYA